MTGRSWPISARRAGDVIGAQRPEGVAGGQDSSAHGGGFESARAGQFESISGGRF